MADHASSVWVSSCAWTDQNHWQEWLNTHPGSELLLIAWADQNYWQEWLKMHLVCELLFTVWADQNPWWEWLNIIQNVSIWANQNNWQEWLNMHLVCELLLSVWADHWQEWLNAHPACESLSSWTDQSHLGWWLNIHPGCESLFIELIRTTDKNGWTCIQDVSHSPAFEKIRITKNGYYCTQNVIQFLIPSITPLTDFPSGQWYGTPSRCLL